MRWSMGLLAVVALPVAAHAATIEQWKQKPPKRTYVAQVDMEKAINCLLEDNSMNVQTIRKDGYVDMPMSISGTRIILATITPEGTGVRVDVRGTGASLIKFRVPCMGLPGKLRSI